MKTESYTSALNCYVLNSSLNWFVDGNNRSNS